MKENQLAGQFSPGKILLYALPTICTMLFMAIYMMVDGIFVAHYVNELAFTAINIAYPAISLVMALGLMLAMGSSAVIGKLLGEGKEAQARRFFTLIYLVGVGLGGCVTLVVRTFPHQILLMLNTTEILYPYAWDYLTHYAWFFVPLILQVFTQTFFVTAGRPMLGFGLCFLGGATNIFLDWLFIGVLDWGIAGAPLATGVGYAVPGLVGVLYFACARKSTLHFTKCTWDWPNLSQSLGNGMSEFVVNIADAISTLLFNVILLRLAGEAGVAAITAILYIQMFQMAVYSGYSFGVAPLVSYKYGAQDWGQLKQIVQVSFAFLTLASLTVIALSYLFAEEAITVFISAESDTFALAKRGLQLYSIGYLFKGINLFMSAFFTALSNGKVSAILSCSRTFVFLVAALFTLPVVWKTDGVWLAVPVAECLAFLLSLYFFRKYRPVYHYWGEEKELPTDSVKSSQSVVTER